MNLERKLHLALGSIAFLVFLGLLVRQEVVEGYQMSYQAFTLLAGAIWAFMQIDIGISVIKRDRGDK